MKNERNQSFPWRGNTRVKWDMRPIRRVILGGFLLAALAGGVDANACSLAFHTGQLPGGEVHLSGRTMDSVAQAGIILNYEMSILPRGQQHDGNKYNDDGEPIPNPAKWTSKYGSLTIDRFGEGVNEMGLSVDMLWLGDSQYAPPSSTIPGVSYLKVPQYLLDNAATVSEALGLLRKVRVIAEKYHGYVLGQHFAIRDASNDMAVIEFVNVGTRYSPRSKMVVYHGIDYDVMTNDPPMDEQLEYYKQFSDGTKGLPGDFNAMDRFVRLKMFKKTLDVEAVPWRNVCNVLLLMDTVHTVPGSHDYSGKEDGEEWPNVWTSVMDLDNMKYYLKLAHYPNIIWVDMNKIDFETLNKIGTLDPKSFKLFGEVNSKFTWRMP